jgi:chromosome segregation ATPase
MSTVEPQRSAPPVTDGGPGAPPGAPPQKKHRNPWIWVSAVLALAAVGLVIWGATTQADLDSSEDDVSELQTQVSNESAESDAAKDLADDLAQDLGSTSEDLAATEEKLEQADQSATKAEEDAAAAKKDADQAQDATEKAQAEAKEAQAQADAAESKTEIAGECARAYVNAFGSLFEGESVKSQAPVVREELESISAQCQSALSGG